MARMKTASLIAAAACFAAILAVPQTASAQSTFIVPFDRLGLPGVDANGNPTGAFDNPCTFEFVDVTGSSTISSTTSVSKQNVRTTNVNIATKGTGAGWVDADPLLDGLQYGLFTGSTYVFSESQTFTIKQQNGTLTDSVFTDKLSMKGVQSIDNWVIRARFRIKIGPDGSVQVSVDKMNEGVCKG
jgi:hypothetical protein